MKKRCYFCDKLKDDTYKSNNSDNLFCLDCLKFKQDSYKAIGKQIDFEKLIDKEDLGKLYAEFK